MTLTITLERQHTDNPTGQRGFVRRTVGAVVRGVKGISAAVISPHQAALSRLAEMPLSIAGTGLVDWASFHVNSGVGLLITGISLWLVEHLISDDDPPRPA
jgi:hypothetical protein